MTNAYVEARRDVTVAVVREKGARFQIERASIDPPRPDDVIVRVVATSRSKGCVPRSGVGAVGK